MTVSRISRAAKVWSLAAAAALTVPALLVVACSSNGTSGTTPVLTGADGSTTGAKGHGEGGTSLTDLPDGASVGPFDAGADQPAIDTLCAQATLLGKPEELVVEVTSAAPPTGGTVAAGTYTLGSLYAYVPPPDGGIDAGGGDDAGGDDDDDNGPQEFPGALLESKTLVLGSDGLFSLAAATGTLDAGVGTTAITAGVYVVSGDSIILHGTCPSTSESTYTFYTSGGLLALYSPDGLAEDFQQIDAPGLDPP
jgi:hypothetical protein